MLKRVLPLLALALLIGGFLIAERWRTPPRKVSGFVEAHEIRLGSRVGGRIAEVFVREGHPVVKDQVLLRLEPYDLLEREARARANLEAARAEHARLRAGFRKEEIAKARARVQQIEAELQRLEKGPRPAEIEAAKAQVEVAEARLVFARSIHTRTRELLGGKSISLQEMDRAVEELEAANGMLLLRKKQLQVLEEGSRKEEIDGARSRLSEAQAALALLVAGYRKEEVDTAAARTKAAEAELGIILAQKNELTIRAPRDGTIESFELEPGDLCTPGAPVLSMVAMDELWIRAYLPERYRLKLGQSLPVSIDALSRRIEGTVTYISRQAEFTPSNVQTPEERSKQVFRIKVSLAPGVDGVRPGMSADVWLDEASEAP